MFLSSIMAELQNVKPWLVKKEERYLISSQTVTIWGRLLTLPVLYDCYAGESVTPEQINAIKHLFSHVDWIEKAKKQVELSAGGIQHCPWQRNDPQTHGTVQEILPAGH